MKDKFLRQQRESLTETAYCAIRRAILEGEFSPEAVRRSTAQGNAAGEEVTRRARLVRGSIKDERRTIRHGLRR